MMWGSYAMTANAQFLATLDVWGLSEKRSSGTSSVISKTHWLVLKFYYLLFALNTLN